MDVLAKLLADDVWSAEDDKTGFLSFGVDIFDRLVLKNNQFPCPWCKLVLLKIYMRNEDKSEKAQQNWNMIFFWCMIKILYRKI